MGGESAVVMGPTHAMSGAAVWLALAPAVSGLAGAALGPAELAASTAVAAGAALLPDIDAPGSTVSRVFGWPSLVVSAAVARVCATVYRVTRGPADRERESGHRTVTHTLVFAVGLVVLVGALCTAHGPAAVAVVLFITMGLAVRGLLAGWAKRAGWIITTAVSAAAALVALWVLPPGSYWWLGFAVGLGALVHLAGDVITRAGCPLLWPLPLGGQLWRELGPPRFLRIRAGGHVERLLVLPGLTLVVLLLGAQAWNPGMLMASALP